MAVNFYVRVAPVTQLPSVQIFISDVKSTHEADSSVNDHNFTVISIILKIILFGSLAEGRGVPGTDADILIIPV